MSHAAGGGSVGRSGCTVTNRGDGALQPVKTSSRDGTITRHLFA